MPVLCTSRAPLNSSTSSIMDTETDPCGKPAKWKDGGPNKNFFFYCDAHREALVNGSPLQASIARNLIPLDGTEQNMRFSFADGSFTPE